MRNVNPSPGYTKTISARLSFSSLFILTLLFINACNKKDLKVQTPITDLLHVIHTDPCQNFSGFGTDATIHVNFDRVIDTSKFMLMIMLRTGTGSSGGMMTCSDSNAIYIPENDLLPDESYTAMIQVASRSQTNGSSTIIYEWSFTTKGPDEYTMNQQSDSVTDFLRDGTRMMQVGNYLYSFGGWSMPEESYNDVYRSTGDLSLWEKRPDAPWHGRHVYGIAKMNGYTYIIGGDNLHNDFDVWRTLDGEQWVQLADHILGDRIYYGCCAHNGYLYVVGGSGHNDAWRSRDGISWEQIATNIPFLNGENFSGSLISYNGKLWMVCGGGSGGGTGIARNTVWSSTDGISWKQEDNFGGTGRYYTDLCIWDNKLWVVGGYNDQESNIKTIWYLKHDGTWNEYVTPANYAGRHATGVAVFNDRLVITCGSYNNDCWTIEKMH